MHHDNDNNSLEPITIATNRQQKRRGAESKTGNNVAVMNKDEHNDKNNKKQTNNSMELNKMSNVQFNLNATTTTTITKKVVDFIHYKWPIAKEQ